MATLTVIAGILQAVSTAAANPQIAGSFSKYAGLLSLAGSLVLKGDEALTELQALKDEIDAMVKDGRDPSIEEQASWKARSDAAHAQLQALKNATAP